MLKRIVWLCIAQIQNVLELTHDKSFKPSGDRYKTAYIHWCLGLEHDRSLKPGPGPKLGPDKKDSETNTHRGFCIGLHIPSINKIKWNCTSF